MKIKRFIFALVFITLIFIGNKVSAGDLELNKLTYDVQLNSDGSADVTEIWDIYIENTNTLFKTFDIDKSKYKEITNVSVKELKNENEIPFNEIHTEMYHVSKNCFYALVNKNKKFEIAWGVQIEDETRTYKISYKIIDAVKMYNDCSEFYWQFISTDSEIPARKIEGTIKLPNKVSNDAEFRVWAHGPLNGNISKISNDTLMFEVSNLKSRTMLEARVVVPREIFVENQNIENIDKLNYILQQEQEWANEANEKREKEARRREIIKKTMIALAVIFNLAGIIIAIIVITKIKKYHKILKENPKVVPEQKIEWYRDIPDETATPAQASLLYYFNQGNIGYNMSKVVSATILDLCLKKYIEFEIIQSEKKKSKSSLSPSQIRIILKSDMDKETLTKDEKIIYELIEKSVNKEKNSCTMKEFQNYCERHSEKVLSRFDEIEKEAKKIEEEKGNYEEKLITTSSKYVGKAVGYLFLAIFSIFMVANIIPSIIATIYTCRLASRYNRLTQKGTNEKEQWIALKNYMEEFSMIDEKSIPELVLWEKYLVYATAFGIADKVLEQLKVVYPQITDTDYMSGYGYAYMHLMYVAGGRIPFITTINTSVASTYNSVNYSSGSGSGGGFSGGGGFGGGGGRNGW